MSFWEIMNWIVWGANGLIVLLLLKDVLQIESKHWSKGIIRPSKYERV